MNREASPLLQRDSSSLYPGTAGSSSAGSSSASASASTSISQIDEDAAFARRLQQMESFPQYPVYGGAGNPPRRASLGGGGGGGGGRDRQEVRAGMLNNLVTTARFTALSFYFLLLLNTPQIVFILYYSVRYGDKFNSCDKPLNLWLAIHGLRLLTATVIAGLPVFNARVWYPLGQRFRRLNDTINLLGFVVFILGNFWIFNTETCRQENPEVFKLAFYLLIIQYVLMLLPCFLLLLLAPCVCCCLPFLIRMSGYLPPGVGLRIPGTHGASESLISKLPPPKKYEIGLFGGSTVPMAASTSSREQKEDETNHDEPECAICLANYSVGELVRELPCKGKHVYHDKCITDWLKVNSTCPVDRENLMPYMVDPSRARSPAASSNALVASSSSNNMSSANRDRSAAAHSEDERSSDTDHDDVRIDMSRA